MGRTLFQLLHETKVDSSRTCINHSLPELEAFLSGILDGIHSCGISLGEIEKDRFDIWLARQHNLSVGRSLFQNLTLLSESDSHGYDLFFLSLNTFLSDKNTNSMWTSKIFLPDAISLPNILDLYPILKCLRDNHETCIRARSITLLTAYLNGWICGIRNLQNDIAFLPDLDHFALWLREQYSNQRYWSDIKWHRIIKYLNNLHENEAKSFDMFFLLLDKWMIGSSH